MPEIGSASPHAEVYFADWGGGKRFCILHRAAAPVRGALVYVHPFAEEMNKSRRMVALAAGRLAAAGWHVLQADLLGCGDSEGDFGDASWEGWVRDVRQAALWLKDQTGIPPSLWGLRTGCLLAVQAARQLDWHPDLLFWQPAMSGRQQLQQFLRIKLAAGVLGGQAGGESVGKWRERLLQGEAMEIAGYMLAPALARGLDEARLDPIPTTGRLGWFEIGSSSSGGLSPAGRTLADDWVAAGWSVAAVHEIGAPFWQTQEIEEVPGLLAGTVAYMVETYRGVH